MSVLTISEYKLSSEQNKDPRTLFEAGEVNSKITIDKSLL